MTMLPDDVRDLLAAIRDALDVPVPSVDPADERAHGRLLPTRADRARIIAQSVLDGDALPGATEHLRRWTAETPITYRVHVPAGKDTHGADQAPTGESTQASTPDPLLYGPGGYRCGCGKPAHSNLVPCAPDAQTDTSESTRPATPNPWRTITAANAARALLDAGPVPSACGRTTPHAHHTRCAGITTAEHRLASPPPGPPAELPGWVYRAERLAVDVAARVRIEHTYTGLITVWVWPRRADEHYRQPVPEHAERFLYPAGQPDNVCPGCGDTVEWVRDPSTGRRECPNCTTDVPEPQHASVSPDCDRCEDTGLDPDAYSQETGENGLVRYMHKPCPECDMGRAMSAAPADDDTTGGAR